MVPPPRPRSSAAHGTRGVAIVGAALLLAGCAGTSGDSESGPPRLTPNPQHDIARAMIENRPQHDTRLNACELLDLTTEEIISLTGADMPDVEPTGSGDLGLICTYGGPGSPERAEAAALEDDEDDDENWWSGDEDDSEASTSSTRSTGTGSTSTTTTRSTTARPTPTRSTTSGTTTGTGTSTTGATETTATSTAPFDPDRIPDTFAAGVVKPPSGAEVALIGQPAMLGPRYACSELKGPDTGGEETSTAGRGSGTGSDSDADPVVPDTEYIDCVAAPAGGGVEVHTIFVVDDRLWHITLIRPEVARSPEAEATALDGLHRVVEYMLG